MPKITRHGGPSNAAVSFGAALAAARAGQETPAVPAADESEPELVELADGGEPMTAVEGVDVHLDNSDGRFVTNETEGGEQPSASTSSSTSSSKTSSSGGTGKTSPRKPARATANRSKKASAGSSTAASAATSGPETDA